MFFELIKEQLGSVRQTLSSTGAIVSGQDYYPYGAYLRSYVSGSDANGKYKFTEKERDALTNYDYFGARYYISRLGRWMAVDPLAAKYPGWSPYNYASCNPLRFIDPTGEGIWDFLKGVVKGTVKTVANTALDIGEAIANGPIQNPLTIQKNGMALQQIAENPMQIVEGIENKVNTFASGFLETEESGEVLGEGIGIALELAAFKKANSLLNRADKLLEISKGTGNFGIGEATSKESMKLGEKWVGKGYTTSKDGNILISKDKLRQYRKPSYKPKLNKNQANFESRSQPSGKWENNGHLDVND
ncbi:MAG: RHS repeat-associated core domain-containing protein [bacterium]